MKTFKVGDRVKNSIGLKGTILMIEGNEAWVKADNAKHGCSTWGFHDLIRLRPKRPKGVWVTREKLAGAFDRAYHRGYYDGAYSLLAKELGL